MIHGAELGKKYNLNAPSLVVGRHSKCDIQINQASISRNHAKFEMAARTIIIRDLGSTNGTYVNDDPVDEYALRDGDLIKIGRTIFKFLRGDNIESAYHEEIYRLTTIDGLTQISNKRHFLDTLEREVASAQRSRRTLSLIMFDIDHFKHVNDTYGHLAGDYVLQQLAHTMRANMRREDFFARYGGEEFAIILSDVGSVECLGHANALRQTIERTEFRVLDATIPVTISVGVASLSSVIVDKFQLIACADYALYEAKRAGRNRVIERNELPTKNVRPPTNLASEKSSGPEHQETETAGSSDRTMH